MYFEKIRNLQANTAASSGRDESNVTLSRYLGHYFEKVFTVNWLNGDDFGMGLAITLLLLLIISLCLVVSIRLYKLFRDKKAEKIEEEKKINKEVFNMSFRRQRIKEK